MSSGKVRGAGRPWRPALAASVIAAAVALVFGAHQGGAAWFLHLGLNWMPTVDLARHLFGPRVAVPYVKGHDGSFFWVLARDPLLVHAHADKLLLDRPTYRAQRIGYPLLAAPWRLLGERALLWGLVVTNVAIVGIGTYQTALLARVVGAPERAAIAFALSPTIVVALIGDLGDALAVLFIVMGLRYVLERRATAAALAFAAGCLSKEAGLLVVAAVLFLPPGSLKGRARLLVAGVPAAAVGAWALYQRWRLGWASTHFLEFNWPFVSYYRGWHYSWSHGHSPANAVMAILLWAVLVVTATRYVRHPSVLRAAAVAPCLLVPIFSDNVISIALNSVRALGPALTILGVDLYAESARRRATLRPAAA